MADDSAKGGSGSDPQADYGDGLSEEDVEKALRGYEHEFEQMDTFDSQLEGLLGEKAKKALLLTPLKSARLLSGFCALAQVQAMCVQTQSGAIALLSRLDGQEPEQAAKSLSQLVSGLSVVLAVNRADQLEMRTWISGQQGEKIPPPLILSAADACIEDYLIGMLAQGVLCADHAHFTSEGLSRDEALRIIREETRKATGKQARRPGFLRRHFGHRSAPGSATSQGSPDPSGSSRSQGSDGQSDSPDGGSGSGPDPVSGD